MGCKVPESETRYHNVNVSNLSVWESIQDQGDMLLNFPHELLSNLHLDRKSAMTLVFPDVCST